MRQLTHLFSPCTSVDGTFLTASCSWFFHFSPQWVKFFFLSSHKLPSLNVSTCLLPQLPVNLGNKVQYPPHKKPFINLNSVIQSRKQLSHFTCAEDFILGHLCGKGCLGLIELSGYLHRSTGVLYIEQGHLITAPAKRNDSFNLPDSNQRQEGVRAVTAGPGAGDQGSEMGCRGDLPKIPSWCSSFSAVPSSFPLSHVLPKTPSQVSF